MLVSDFLFVLQLQQSQNGEHNKYKRHFLQSFTKIYHTHFSLQLPMKLEAFKNEIILLIGQSRLLLNKKLKQFEQLLADPEGTTADMPPITLSDLEGFWEVVMIQVLHYSGSNRFSLSNGACCRFRTVTFK